MRTALAAALLALTACGAAIQVDRVCTTSNGYTFASARAPVTSAPLPPVRLSFSLGAAVPDLTQNGVHDVHVLARSFGLTSTQSAAFVTSLTVSVVPPAGSALPKLTVGTYTRPAGFGGGAVDVTADGADLFPYMQGGRLTLELAGEADLSQAPTGTFTAAAEMCAEVQGSIDYL